MEEPQQQTLRADDDATLVSGGEEATLVAPRFDDEETLVARPVVPLEEAAEEVPGAAPDLPAVTAAGPAPYYRRNPFAPSRSWLPALMLVSVLVGGVLGGAGLYLYQRQTGAVVPGATTQKEAPAEPAPPAAEGQSVEPARQQADAPRAEEQSQDKEAPPAAPAREHESVPAAERREPPAEGVGAGAPKRGKKGERDEEIDRPARRAQPDGIVSRGGEREARRVDSIVYRPRRVTRRERARRDAADDTDRLRRIFEGTPE